ncbi:VTC domain-containing protein [Corallococcus sp. CA054B]|uniref:VTC domain-containing protein n=1 Tax=Corallococcus sp. CA054B TaxID=2316734 RepID=UPI000EA15433|nr:VTC domain-containing protein [Corallococcus sp. CA054B]RKG62906.1 VTC domain-containing protein [Corallococcus sp. CA054B]
MTATARVQDMDMPTPAAEQDRERRFQPSREALASFLGAVQGWVSRHVYAQGLPVAYTRTTYLDTEGLDFLGTCHSGQAERLRLREYAGAAHLTEAPVLTGTRFLELKRNHGERRTKVRLPVTEAEARAVLSGQLLPVDGAAARLLRQASLTPVRPWITAWYRRTTLATVSCDVRITLDEGLVFALPPDTSADGALAVPTRLVGRAPPAMVVEVKWKRDAPSWLEEALWGLSSHETAASKFEQGMRALLEDARPMK